MRFTRSKFGSCKYFLRSCVAIVCCLLMLPSDAAWAIAWQDAQQAPAAKLSADQLDTLVAPIALYPDALLSQTLMASTYPLEIIQLQQWLQKNPKLKDKALADAVAKQPWDPSIQQMAGTPDLVKQLADNISWTTDLGNAFLAQQNDVMDAVQRMRGKAKDKGNLKTTEQQKVEVQTVESKQVIVIQPSNPEVVYVPSYNPTVVYGPPVYPPPPYYPPPPPPGYYAAGLAISFGVGMAMGAWWGGGSCCGCGWGGNNNVYINNNNNFVRNTNIQGGNRVNARGGNSTWNHNPQHRGGAPYGDRNTANRFGGSTRGDPRNRQNAGNRNGVGDRNGVGNRGGVGDRNGVGDRGGVGDRNGAGDRGGNRGGSPSAGTMDRGSNRGTGGGDRVGNRNVPSASSRNSGAFSGGSASSARASSARGSSSFGGGGSRGGRSGGGGRRR